MVAFVQTVSTFVVRRTKASTTNGIAGGRTDLPYLGDGSFDYYENKQCYCFRE